MRSFIPCQKAGAYLRTKAADVPAGFGAFFSEDQSETGHCRHCSEEQRTLIKKLIRGRKTHKVVQKMRLLS